MLIGLLMLLAPSVLFLVTLPLSARLRPWLRKTYRSAGGIVVFLGSGFSFYLAAYTGDQGGIAAYFFQIAVISVYLVLSVTVVGLNSLAVLGGAREGPGGISAMDRSGEKFGWAAGWFGGFIWVVILSLLLLLQGRAIPGTIGLGFAALAVIVIAAFAPWRHPQTRYWKLMTPIYAVFFASVVWAIQFFGTDGLGLGSFSVFLVLPLLLPIAVAGGRRWSDAPPPETR
jgi:hypothetical protein